MANKIQLLPRAEEKYFNKVMSNCISKLKLLKVRICVVVVVVVVVVVGQTVTLELLTMSFPFRLSLEVVKKIHFSENS
jgi:hypothetical protein